MSRTLLLERPEWHRQAACRGMGADLFHPVVETGRPTRENVARIKEAKAVCARCPVAAECLAEVAKLAPRADLATGAIRGGLTPSERHPETIAKKRAAVRAARARNVA